MPEQASPVPEVTYYGNGKVKYRGANLDGQMHGPWEFFRTDGSLMRRKLRSRPADRIVEDPTVLAASSRRPSSDERVRR